MNNDTCNTLEAREQRLRWALLLRSWGHIPTPLRLPHERMNSDETNVTKKPKFAAWPDFPMPSEPMLRQWIVNEGRNYGVLCGERSARLCVIDFDNLEAWEEWSLTAPAEAKETLTIASARGVHLYVTINELPAHKLKMSQGRGDVLATGAYVVGPGSIHPSGATYRVTNDYAIRRIESLDEMRLPIEQKPAPQSPAHQYIPRGDVALGGAPSMARIAGVVAAFAEAVEGSRNALLLWSACRCFDEGMSSGDVIATLLPVSLALGLSASESLATIASAERQERRASSPPAQRGASPRSRLSPRERQQQRRRGR